MTAAEIRVKRELVIRGFLSDLAADYGLWMPRLLDGLERLDREHVPDGVIKVVDTLTDEEAQQIAEQWAAGNFPSEAVKILPPDPSDVTQIDPRITEEARALAEADGQTLKRTAAAKTTRPRTSARGRAAK